MTYDDPVRGAADDGTDLVPAGMVSLSTLKRAVWRRRRIWLVTAVVGIVLGASLHVVVPRKYVATMSVYLVEPTGADPQEAYANDLSLLETRAVAKRAITALRLHVPVAAFLGSYQGSSEGDALMSIRLSASSPAQALASDNAVAKAFLSFRATEVNYQTQSEIDGMAAEAKTLEAQITDLSSQIDRLSSVSGSSAASERNGLVNQQTGDITQAAELEGQIQQDRADITTVVESSRVIDPASLVVVSTKKTTVADALAGAVGGLGGGVIFVVLATVLSDRLRSRHDVAAALGAPVELSMARQRLPLLLRRRRWARRMRKPGPSLELAVGRLRDHLEASTASALAVVTVDADEVAAAAVCLLARGLSAGGRKVVVADMVGTRPVARLFGLGHAEVATHEVATHEIGTDAEETGSLRVIVAPDNPARLGAMAAPDDADAVLVLTAVDVAVGADHLATWATDVVVMIGAGRANATRVVTTGQLVRNAGLDLRAAILVGADRDDDSLGKIVRHPASEVGAEGYLAVVAPSGRW